MLMETQYEIVTLFAIRALSGARTRRDQASSMKTTMQPVSRRKLRHI
jgi:hypothetical protein